ncbi:hypothetical protein ACC754_39440, partial [Rhizobium johnstonii]
ENFRRSRGKDRNGYVGFDVSFIPSSNDAGAVLSIGDVTEILHCRQHPAIHRQDQEDRPVRKHCRLKR